MAKNKEKNQNKVGFKQKMKNAGQKTKAYVSEKTKAVKEYSKKYGEDLSAAYNNAYTQGWENAYDVPNRFGARLFAMLGYGKGISARKKADKSQQKYEKYAKKNI